MQKSLPLNACVLLEVLHGELDALDLAKLSVILLKDDVLCANFVSCIDDSLDVHDTCTNLAEIERIDNTAKCLAADELGAVVVSKNIYRACGSLGEVLLMNSHESVADLLDDLNRICTAAHCPECVDLESDILRICVLEDVIEDILAADLLELMIVVVDNELHAFFSKSLTHSIVVLASLEKVLNALIEICGLADVLVAYLLVILEIGNTSELQSPQ